LALEASLLSAPLREFVESQGEWNGTASELLKALSRFAPESVVKQRGWPKKPNGLSGALRRLAPNLRRVGIEVSWHRDEGKKRSRIIKLQNRPAESPRQLSSASSASSEDRRNQQAVNCLLAPITGSTLSSPASCTDRPPVAGAGASDDGPPVADGAMDDRDVQGMPHADDADDDSHHRSDSDAHEEVVWEG
jgi:hypothetical protein